MSNPTRTKNRSTATAPGGSDAWVRAAIWVAVVAVVAVLPGAFDRWVLPKDAVLAIAAVIGAAGIARGRLPRWFLVVSGAGAVLLVLAAIMSAAPLLQLFGRYPRFEGLVTLPVYFVAVWLGARTLGPGADVRARSSLFTAAGVVSCLLGLVSIVEAFGARPLESDLDRPGALLGNATDQGVVGAVLAVLLAVELGRRGSGSAAALPAVGLVFAVATVALSGSRAALVAAAVGLLLVGAIGWWLAGAGRRRAVVVTGISLAGLAAFAFLLPQTRDRIVGVSQLSAQTVTDRFSIWQAAWQVLGGHPLLGVGPSGFEDAVTGTYRPTGPASLGVASVLDSPHSWILQFAMAGGWPLVLLALAAASGVLAVGVHALRSAIRAGDRDRARLLGAALAGTVVTGIGLATQFTSPGAVILACLLVGVLVARPAGRQLRTIPRRAGVAAAAAWALVLAIGAGSGIALQQAVQVSATDIAAADGLFAQAQSARPWDGDLPSIAAESFAAAASDKVPGAGPAAVRWAQRSLALAPDTQASLVALGVGQQASGDLDAARLSFARAYDRNHSNEQALSYLGIVEATQQDYTAARDHLLIASRLLPTDVRAWTGLAYVYQQLGDKASADAAHARAVALTPG